MPDTSRLHDAGEQLAELVEKALAKGILMASQRCDADAAFDILRRASQRENRKLRVLADEIVARAVGQPTPR